MVECAKCAKSVASAIYKQGAPFCFGCMFPQWDAKQYVMNCSKCQRETFNKQPAMDGHIYCKDCDNGTMKMPKLLPASVNTTSTPASGECTTCVKCGKVSQEKYCKACKDELDRTVHCSIKVTGARDKVEFFLWLMKKLDSDWPMQDAPRCKKCGGVEYRIPCVDGQDLREIGDLVGVKRVKVKYWEKASKCGV